jgi:hypothetical protein
MNGRCIADRQICRFSQLKRPQTILTSRWKFTVPSYRRYEDIELMLIGRAVSFQKEMNRV